jgi:hypothetical protein
MATPLDRARAAWHTGDPWALHRVVEALAAEGVSRSAIENLLEALLLEVRAAGEGEDREAIVESVWDRITGWCHRDYHIHFPEPQPAPPNGAPAPTDRPVSPA